MDIGETVNAAFRRCNTQEEAECPAIVDVKADEMM